MSPQGQLARLSVAVILDDERVTTKAADGTATTTTKPWEAAEIQRLQGLVAAAVGLDTKRGDQLTVENISFEVPAVEVASRRRPAFGTQSWTASSKHWPSALRGVGILLVASFALFGILRPLARRATTLARGAGAARAAAAAARLPTVSGDGRSDRRRARRRAGPDSRRLPVLTKRVAKLASEEPEQLARIVRGWMAEEQR